MRHLRQRFWLAAMDVIAWLGGFGSQPYLFAVRRAAATIDWGDERYEEKDDGPF